MVCDEVDFGAMIAAEYLNIPYATVLVIASGSFIRKEVVGEALNKIRFEYGLPYDPELKYRFNPASYYHPFHPAFAIRIFPFQPPPIPLITRPLLIGNQKFSPG